ncbi:CadC family transcriptional regulator [Shewanella sp. 10N.286.51.B7]|uniref:winged helix-turn-helix domain-containing protein n=1 Tax=Shewanella sp. 10N.286.51.B7 TaxID=1880836 RepID=UPI000C81BBEA|nr:winged helix-turn-helix domain-containing protein [Shewanella sp. 10N.286.51.B7]PMG77000.1 CadC family transcriptional regulator [Shewanella sp. 10N.286.51.B7]
MLKITSYLTLDTSAKQLINHLNDEKTSLTFSENAVLIKLLDNSEEIWTKEHLLAEGWPDRVVAPTSLTQCISTLRRKLEPFSEIHLKAVARRGYQLHIDERSHVKMVSLTDSGTIRAAFLDVSVMVKIAGALFVIGLIILAWYQCEYHKVLKNTAFWSSGKQVELNIGGVKESATLLYKDDTDQLHESKWQKHIAPESNVVLGLKGFSAFALTNGNNYSFAACPGYALDDCNGVGIININALSPEPAGLNMREFVPLTKKMEERIRFNRVLIPKDSVGNIIEHHYHADVYFPAAGEKLIRGDFSLSLVYDGEKSGQIYTTTCITDEDCSTTPIKWKTRGTFNQYEQTIGDYEVDVFYSKIAQKEFIKPDFVTPSAMRFYREIRRMDIQETELIFFRVHSTENTAVWIFPFMDGLVAWSKYEKVQF